MSGVYYEMSSDLQTIISANSMEQIEVIVAQVCLLSYYYSLKESLKLVSTPLHEELDFYSLS